MCQRYPRTVRTDRSIHTAIHEVPTWAYAHHSACASGIIRLQFQGSKASAEDVAASAVVTTTAPTAPASEAGSTNVTVTNVPCPRQVFGTFYSPTQYGASSEVRLSQQRATI